MFRKYQKGFQMNTTSEKLICPVCGKEFKATPDTCYIISGRYTCSWKCFLNEVKRREKEKAVRKRDKANHKRT